MKILKVFENNPNPKFLDMAVEALRDGDIVIYPTDTLYAIGCDALNNSAINKICKLKGINPDKTNLSIICDGISMAAEYARFDNRQFKVLKTNLPGPFTFILPSSSSLPKVFKGRKTVGIRVPENNVAVELVRRLGNPILSTTISYTDDDYAEIGDYFNDKNWGTGNMLNIAALTVGNKGTGSAYQYPSELHLINTTVESAGQYGSYCPALYAWANQGEGLGVTITYDSATQFKGDLVYGSGNITVNGKAAEINE